MPKLFWPIEIEIKGLLDTHLELDLLQWNLIEVHFFERSNKIFDNQISNIILKVIFDKDNIAS